jgi:hypothetical protein
MVQVLSSVATCRCVVGGLAIVALFVVKVCLDHLKGFFYVGAFRDSHVSYDTGLTLDGRGE